MNHRRNTTLGYERASMQTWAFYPSTCYNQCSRYSTDTAELWHARFTHAGYDVLARIAANDMVTGFVDNAAQFRDRSSLDCDACMKGKRKRCPFPSSKNVESVPMELVFTDVCSVSPKGPSGHRYFVTVHDLFPGTHR